MREVALYVHVPFCVRKCHYCSFNSVELEDGPSGSQVRLYIEALKREMGIWGAELSREGREVATIYLGGETPTSLGTPDLLEILGSLREHFHVRGGIEITMEANPGTIGEEKLQRLREEGVNRLSIGLQSTHEELLKRLGRAHTLSDFERCFSLARKAGFDNINVDLIFAIPGEAMEHWMGDLAKVTSFGPEHISTYNLTLEEGTRLWRAVKAGELELPGEDLDCDMYEAAIAFLGEKGYQHYEISNFARPGRRCRHNLTYWRSGDYLGIGPGAHSHLEGMRHFNVADLSDYSNRLLAGESPVGGTEDFSIEREMYDYVMMGLRLLEGLDVDEFERLFGRGFFSVFGEKVARLTALGLLEATRGGIRLTRRGLLLANEVLVELLA